MSVIIINCVTLGSYEPCLDEAECDNKCQILKAVDDVIYAYFAAEMIIKMVEKSMTTSPYDSSLIQIALGVFGRGCYLAESWNKLDCFIVLTGYLVLDFIHSSKSLLTVPVCWTILTILRALLTSQPSGPSGC